MPVFCLYNTEMSFRLIEPGSGLWYNLPVTKFGGGFLWIKK